MATEPKLEKCHNCTDEDLNAIKLYLHGIKEQLQVPVVLKPTCICKSSVGGRTDYYVQWESESLSIIVNPLRTITFTLLATQILPENGLVLEKRRYYAFDTLQIWIRHQLTNPHLAIFQ